MKDRLIILFVILGLLTCGETTHAQQTAAKHVLRKEAPTAALARPLGKPAPTESLRVAISLPLRNREALDGLLKRLYDPGSPDYRQYLTPEQFTANFGPTAEDYQKVINFAESFGLSIEQTHDNRLLLDVRGHVADLERAFHVSLRIYQHPREARQFRAPEAEPWVDPKLPIQEITGLSDYVLLRPTANRKPVKTKSGAAGGSSPIAGDFIGQDFRNAYAPGVSLTGAGQRVGLFEADGYYSDDIDNYEAYAGQSSVALQNVLIDGFNGVPGALNPEVAADIEMAIAMAPGLAAVVVFECTNSVSGTNSGGTEVQYWLDTLDRMATSNQIKQFSSSWGYVTSDPTQNPNTAFDAAFKQMATQGQSFFQASGDGDAWATPIWVPADSPYVTSVGGTLLNMNGLGASFASETVWNSGFGPPGWPIIDNNYWGSGGGVSTVYAIPYWQTNINMTSNLGSTTSRNIPDVSMAATNIFITADNGEFGGYFGTSCSAPLWAGFNALINQQAANSNKPPVGFINPAIYALGQGPNYNLCFHDTTTGSNTYPASPTKYFAKTGFDLCTGWGTPTGSNLINALAGVYQPTITTPPNGQTVGVGGSVTFTVVATGVTPLSYQWQFGGVNIASATQTSYSLSNLVQTNAGNYTVVVTNQWGSVTSSIAALTVNSGTPVITWGNPAGITYGTALGSVQLNATANVAGTFIYTPASGTVLNAGNNTLTVVFTPTDTVDYSKATNTVSQVVSPASLTITANNKTKTYGQTVTFAGTEFTKSGLVNGNTVTSVTLTSSGSAATAGVGSSPYGIVPSAAVGTGLANYNITYVNGSMTVSKVALSVTASAQSKTYGQTVTFGSGSTLFTSSGLQNSETIGSVTLAVSSSGGAATASVSSSPYTITPSAATGGTFLSGNYTITYHTASLTVSRAALSITASAESKTYGQTVTFGSGSTLFTSSGLKNGETVGTVTLGVSGSGGLATAPVSGSPYTITPSAATGGTFTANNYTLSYITGGLTVGPAALTITASAESKTYGQTVSFGSGSALFTSSGLKNGETVGTVTLGVSAGGGLATAPVSGSPYTITPSAVTGGTFAAGNYSITYNPGNLTVNPAALTVTANAQSKSYGQTVATGSGSAQFTSSALQNGETIGSVTLSVNNSGAAATAPVSGSPYTITPSAATGGTFSAGNYSITYASGSLTVSPVGLTITASAESKSYGQTVAFGAGSGLFASSGLQNSETIGSVTLAVSGNGGAATALVSGSPYTITPSAATGGTFTPGNYSIAYANGALTVNAATLTITASAESKTYGQTVAFGSGSTLFTSSGLQNGETIGAVTLSVNNNGGAATAPVSGSPYIITPSAATGGTFTPGNYSIAYANGALTVNAGTLTITASAESKTYGQTVAFGSGSTLFTSSGLQNGETIGTVTLGVSGSGGLATAPVSGSPYTITPSAATGGTFVTGNYSITYASGSLTVSPAGLTITASAESKSYGQTVAFGAGSGLFASSGLQNGETIGSVTLAVSGNGGAATAVVSGSPYLIIPSSAAGGTFTPGNYLITYANGALTVNAAVLTITASAQSKTYGQTLTFGSGSTLFTSSGLQNGETIGAVTLSVNNNGGAATALVSGSPYTITPSAATGGTFAPGNYLITYANGALTVNAAVLTITASAQSKTYGQTLAFGSGSGLFASAGLQNGETIGTVTLSVNNNGGAATAPVSGSPYIITPSAATGGTFDPGNYSITYATANLTVGAATLTITANAASKSYGQTVAFGSGSGQFTSSGLQNGETIGSVTLAVSGNGGAPTAPVAGSPYTITPSAAVGGTFSSANYAISYVPAGLTVSAAGLTVTASPESKSYGQTVLFGGGSTFFTSSGLQNGETIDSVTLAVSGGGGAATALVSGSPYTITANAATGGTFSPGNYLITYAPGALTVSGAVLTITASAQTKIYGQTVSFGVGSALFSANGLQNGETIGSVTLSVNNNGGISNAPVSGSPYTISPSAATGGTFNAGNYAITYANGNLTVSPAGLTVTANNQSKGYGQGVVFGSGSVLFGSSGLQNGEGIGSVTLSVNNNGGAASAPVSGSPYVITPSGATGGTFSPGNYSITYASGSLTVNPAALTITANNRSKTYGQTVSFAGTEFTTSGLLNSDSVGGVTLSSSGVAASATVAGSPYAIVPSGASGTGLGNYIISYNSGTLTVNRAGLTVTANNRSKMYGQTVSFAGTEFTTIGLLNGDTVTSASISSLGAAATAGVAGSPYAIVPSAATGTGLNNYTLGYGNGTLTVNPATLSITANNRSKTYGQTVTFAGTEFTTIGLLNSDSVSGVTLGSSGVAATATVAGSPYAIVPSAAAGTGLGNYTIGYSSGTLTINPAALSITANNRSKTYGQTVTFAGTEFTTLGLLNGDTVTGASISSSGTAATATVAGSPYSIVPSGASGTGLGNYIISYNSGTLTINAAALSITANNRSKTYGQTVTFAGTEFTTLGLLNGDTVTSASISSSGATATATVAGSPYAIVPSAAAGTGLNNYTIGYSSGTLTVNAAALSITANNRSKTYGQTVTFAGTEFTTIGLLNSDSVSGVTLGSSGVSATATVAGSPYAIVPSAATGTGLNNYTIGYSSGTLTVNPAALSITANNRSKTYGQTVTFAGTEFTTIGLLNSDSVSGVTLGSSGVSATATVAGSPYAIVPSAATGTGLNNYTIGYSSGTLTVNRAGLTLTANNRSKTYGQTVSFAGTEFTTLGLLNGDTVASATLSSSGTAATATVAGSPYAIVPSAASGTGLGNYIISYNSGTLTVNPAALSITANNRSKTYGQTVTFAGTEFTTIGLLNSDSVGGVTLSSSGVAASATVAGSPYAIVPSGASGTGLGNYIISYNSGTLTVNPAALSITANNRSKTYGQTVTFAGTEFTTSGLLNGDTVTSASISSLGAASSATVAGSPYAIVPSAATGTGLGNYTIGYGNGTLTINPAALSITANNRSKTYGQTVTFAGTEFTTIGLLNSDSVGGVTLSSSGAAASATVAGSPYAIVPSAATGTGLNNYTLSYGNGTLTINPATLTITANNRSKTYGQTVTFAGTEFSSVGLLNSDTVSSVSLSSLGAASSASVSGSPYAIVPSAAVGTGLGNYTIGYVNGTMTVIGSGVTLTWNNPAAITYGAALSSSQLNATASVPGTFAYTPTNNSVLNSGNNPLTVVFTPTDTVDYSSVTDTVSLVVSPATLTVTAASYSRPFNTANPVFTGTITGIVNSDNLTANYSSTATPSTPLGSYAITPILVDPSNRQTNYSVTLVNGSLSIVQATPVVTWTNPPPIIYGNALDGGQLNATANVPGTFAYTPPGGTVLNSGSNGLSVVFTPNDPVDYGMATNTVSLIVGLANLTVTADSFDRPFDTANPVFTGTVAGVVNGDNITATYNSTATISSSVGTYPITPTLVDPGNRETNYIVSLVNGILVIGHPTEVFSWTTPDPIVYGTPLGANQLDASVNVIGAYAYSPTNGTVLNTGTNTLTVVFTPNDTVDYIGFTNSISLVVTPAPLTITGAVTNRQYGLSNPALMGTISGVTNGDIITDTFSCSATIASPVGSYAIVPGTAIGADLTNYTITYVNGSLTVGSAALTITANNRSKTYGQAVSFGGTEFAVSGLLNEDSVTSVSLASPGVAGSASVSGSPYTISPSAAVGNGLANYAITYANGNLTVSPAGLTVTANNQSKGYGQGVVFGSGSVLFGSSGLQNGEGIGSVTLSVNNNGGAASAPVSGSPYVITPSGATGGTFSPGNYSITYASGSLTVNPAALTITANNRSKTYGQTVSFAGTEFTTSGLLNSDSVGGVTLSSSGVAASATVAGSPYAIVPSGASGTGLGNYIISYNSGTLTVNRAGLTVTANNRSKTYGQTVSFAGTEFTTIGLLNGDTVTSASISSLGAAATAGVAGSPYAIVPSAATGTGLNNYTLGYGNGTLTVNPATLSITANNRSKTYGQTVTFAGTEFTTIGLLNSDSVSGVTLGSSGVAATATVAGSPYAIVPSAAAGTGLGNYTIGYSSGTLTINPAALSITANNRSKTYGQTVSFAGTEFTTLGLLNGDTVTGASISSSGTAATATVAGSPYSIVPSGASGTGLGNYIISYNSGTLTINAAALSITANNRSKTYGQTVTFAGTEFTTLGLLNGDTVTSASISSSGATATATVAGSPYAIVPSAAAGTGLNNYTIGYSSGTLTVNAAALSITANNRSKTYGQTVTFAGTEFTTIGLLNSDSVSGVTLGSSGVSATATVAGSPYAIVPSAATGTGLNNYTIGYSSGTLTVNPAALSITANNRSKTYGQTVTFAGTEFTTIGLLNSDSVGGVTLGSSGVSATATVAGSPYAIVPSGASGTGLGNYAISYNSGTLTVNRAGLTVTANNRSKTYGQTVSFAGTEFTTLGLLNGDTVASASISSLGAAASATVAGSPYAIVPSAATGTGLGNYTIGYGNGTLTINPAALSITANNRSKTYGQTVTFAGTEFTTIGLLNSDSVGGVTLSSSGVAASATVAGSPYAIVPSGASGTGLGNYIISYNSGTLTVNPAALSITANNRSKTYGQTVTFAGTEFTTSGLLNGDTVTSASISSLGAAASATVAGSPYAIVPSAATGTGLGNYTIGYGNGTLTINPAALSITANNRSKTYGQTVTFAGTEFTTIGLLNSDSVGGVTLSSSGAAASATVAGSPYAIVPSAATGTGLNNYTLSYGNGTLTINPATLTITANNRSKTYGQTVTFAGTEFSSVGLLNSDTVSSVSLSSLGAASSASVSGSPYAIVPSAAVGTGLGNYTIGYVNGTMTVIGSGVTLTWNNPAAITYGAALSSSQLNATASVPGTFAYTPTNNSVLNSGNNPLTVVFTPTDTVDYSSVTDTVSLVVSPATLTVTAASYSRPFNTANPVFTGTITGIVNSDNLTANYSSTATVSSTVGTYPIVPALVDPNNRRTNYTVSLVSGILVIGHPAQVHTWTNPAPIIYGTPLSSVQLNETINVVGTYAYSPAAGTILNTGTNTLSVIFTPADPIDYTSVTDNVSLVVLPGPLKITAANTTRQYGQANPVFTGTITGVTNGDIITDSYASGATTASPVGTYTITPGPAVGSDLTNYSITYVNGTLTITPATLTVTANSRTKSYGQPASFAGTEFTTSGLLNGDTVSHVNITSSGASPTATVAGSPYAIVPGAATGSGLGNYSITYANGTLTVSPAGLTITANNQTKTFGQTVNFTGTEFTASGLFNGDSVIGVSLVSSGSAATASVAGSPYVISASAANGSGLGNYTITYVGGRFAVLEASPIVSWSNPNPIIYGTDLDANELNATASVPGNFTYTPTNGTVLNSGSNTLSVLFTPSDPADYTVVTASVSLTVLPAPLTVTADSFSRSFDADNPTFTGTIVGLTNGDVISASYSCAAGFSSPVGAYPIVPSLIDPGNRATNYSVNLVDGILVVGHPVEAFNWTNPAPIVYGTPLSVVQLNALVNVLGTYAYSPTNGTVLNTGTNILSVIFTPSDSFDYTSVTDFVSLIVTPAPLGIAGPAESRQYGQANPDLTGTITGLTHGDDISVSFSSTANPASPVGTYAIVPGLATGSDLTNYTISYANGSLTVAPAALNITANNRSKVYGQGLTFIGNEFAAVGLVNGDSVSSVSLSSAGAPASSLVAGSPYVITPSAAIGSGLANYTITYVNGSLLVTPAGLTVTANNQTKTFGQTVNFTGTEFTASGLFNGDSVIGVSLVSSGSAATASVAGSPYVISASAANGSGLGNYTITYVGGRFAVLEASPIVSWSNPNPIIYGTDLDANELNATASVPGNFTYTPTNGTVLNSGSNTLSVLFTPSDPADYTVVTASVSLTVLPAPLTVTADSFSRSFDADNPTFTGTIVGLTNGDVISASYSCAAGFSSPVGAYPIVPSLIDPGNRATNYSVNLVDGILVVGHPVEAFNWTNPAPIVYGTPLSVVQLNALVNVLGTYAYSPTNGTVLNTGTNILSVIFTPSDSFDYTSVTDFVSLIVTPAPLGIAGPAESRQYGQANPDLTGTITGLTHGDDISVSFSSTANPASPVGTYAIVPGLATGSDLTNYTISYANGSLTVAPAALNITANNRSKVYGQGLTFIGNEFAAVGLVNGDSVSSVSLSSAGAPASSLVAGSPYVITPSAAIGSGLANYTITYVNGSLLVTPAGLTVTANNQTKTFGQTVNFTGTEFTASGLFNGDTVASVTLTSLGSSVAATVDGSPYAIIPSAAQGVGLANYAISYINGALTVSSGSQPVIQSATKSGDSIIFNWSTAPFQSYQIQYTTNLAGEQWFDLGDPVTATNSSAAATVSITNSQTFYRLLLLP